MGMADEMSIPRKLREDALPTVGAVAGDHTAHHSGTISPSVG
jgi:hypothetical protein